MFKIGDIVVKTRTSSSTNRLGSKKGDIWKINKLTKYTPNSAYYQDGNTHSSAVRKAKNSEIKWFEAGITNINQIPEVGGTYNDANGVFRTIKNINYNDFWIYTFEIYGPTVRFSTFINECLESYKPPIKSEPKTWNKAIPIDTPFEVGDLKNCKIGNLTPEDHEIIQPFLFSLGYKWASGSHLTKIDQPYLCTTRGNYIFKKSNITDFNRLQRTPIKKETILNYIKQLNTNNNYEQINKKAEIKPESRTIRGSSISIPTITGRIASASRLIGNKASGKCVKSQIRKFEISANIVTC